MIYSSFVKFVIKMECSVRAYSSIVRHGIDENTDLSDISKFRNIGIKSGAEIIDLQNLYKIYVR